MQSHRKSVVIVQSTIRHYRVGFFAGLHDRLAREGIDLRVVYSDPNAREVQKHDYAELNGEVGVKVRADWLFTDRLVYQHAWRQVGDASLVVVEQASKHLLNYALFASRAVSTRKIALWGHGFSRHGTAFARLLRNRMLRFPEWWFAYTSRSVQYLIAQGVPAEITTNVQNAIDTNGLSKAAEGVSSEQVAALRCALGISPNAYVGLFCGSLYADKNLPMLIASSKLVRAALPDFNIIILGDGPDRNIVKDAASRNPWVHYLGPVFGDDRAIYFRMANIVMNPGLVGLGILDAFAVGLPVITTDNPLHSPEIEYLEEGRNGLISQNAPAPYAAAITGCLSNRELLMRLRAGAYLSGRKYTMERMVENFAGGVESCLECRRGLVETRCSSS